MVTRWSTSIRKVSRLLSSFIPGKDREGRKADQGADNQLVDQRPRRPTHAPVFGREHVEHEHEVIAEGVEILRPAPEPHEPSSPGRLVRR